MNVSIFDFCFYFTPTTFELLFSFVFIIFFFLFFVFFFRNEDNWTRQGSIRAPSHIVRRPSLGFDAMPADELAEVLASIDYKLFRRVPVS